MPDNNVVRTNKFPMDEFKSIVTNSKRNHRYYGPTESEKMASSLSEISVDLRTVFNEIELVKDNIIVLASGYIMPSGFDINMHDKKMKVNNLENRMSKMIYIQAEQAEIL